MSSERMTTAMVPSVGASTWLSPFRATLRAEFIRRVRHRTSLFQLLLFGALAALLVPSSTARYAIISAHGLRPQLSADTALVTAGVVLAVVLFPIYSLVFDAGRQRDASQHLDRLFATAPVSPWQIGAGRFMANVAFGSAVVAIAGLLLISTLHARYGTWPGLGAATAFLGNCLPVICLAAVTGLTLDLVLPDRPAARTALAFLCWMALVVLSVTHVVDPFGLDDLRRLIGDPTLTDALSIGFISVTDQQFFLWKELPAEAWQLIGGRLVIMAGWLILGAVVIAFLGRWLHPVRLDAIGVGTRGTQGSEIRVDRGPPAAAGRFCEGAELAVRRLPAIPGDVALLRAVSLFLTRLFRRSPVGWLVLIAALATGVMAKQPGAAIAMAAVAPLLLLARTSPAEVRVAAVIERSQAGLSSLGPALIAAMAIAAAMLAAAAPALVRVPPMQAATAVFGLAATAAWLVWAYRIANLPTLGVAVSGGLDYLLVFNDVPAHADILGLWQPSATACLIASGLTMFFSIALYRSARA